MNRRDTLLALLACGAVPLLSFAQQPGKVWRIGYLDLGTRQSAAGRLDMLLNGLREAGYDEGRNLVIDGRYADGNVERLDGQAAEIVRLNVDVIVTWGTQATRAAQRATTSIPIVVAAEADPVGNGFAASMARPGGNITGMSTGAAEIVQKYVELLRTMIPKLSRIAVVYNPTNVGNVAMLQSVQVAGKRLGWEVLPIGVRVNDLESGFAAMARDRAGAVIILPDASFNGERQRISALALKHRLPSIAMASENVDAGILMTYGASMNDNGRRAATLVDKVFKGGNPAELPFELPTRFYLDINRSTARSLGLAVPQELLLRADRVV